MLLRTKPVLLLAVIAAGACESTYPTAQMPSIENLRLTSSGVG